MPQQTLSEVSSDGVVCPTCGRTDFESRRGVELHHAKTHGESIAGELYTCDNCGESYRNYPSNETGDTHFCGMGCYAEWQSKHRTGENHPTWKDAGGKVNCEWCGVEAYREPRKKESRDRFYCSTECMSKWRSENITGDKSPFWKNASKVVTCSNCGDSVETFRSRLDTKDHFFCDRDCYAEWQSHNLNRENHPNWKGGGPLYYGENWLSQREKALQRDDYTCQDCGKTQEEIGREPDVHHKVPLRKFDSPEDANELKNLISLCRSCHNKWESGQR